MTEESIEEIPTEAQRSREEVAAGVIKAEAQTRKGRGAEAEVTVKKASLIQGESEVQAIIASPSL